MPRKTLVLNSGGVLGVVYGGVFRCIEEKGFNLNDFEVIYGTSVGALVGALVTIGMSYKAIRSLLINLPIQSFFNITSHSLLRLPDTCGLDNGKSMRKLIQSVFFRVLRKPRPTFGELYRLTSKTFTVNAVDIRTGKQVLFGTHHTPDVFVEDGICASAAIPFLYAPVRINNMVLVDGCVCDALLIKQVPKEDLPTTLALLPMPKMEDSHIHTVLDVMKCSYTTLMNNSVNNLLNSASKEALAQIVRIYTPLDASLLFDANKSNTASMRETLDFIGYTEASRSETVALFIQNSNREFNQEDYVPSGTNVVSIPEKPQQTYQTVSNVIPMNDTRSQYQQPVTPQLSQQSNFIQQNTVPQLPSQNQFPSQPQSQSSNIRFVYKPPTETQANNTSTTTSSLPPPQINNHTLHPQIDGQYGTVGEREPFLLGRQEGLDTTEYRPLDIPVDSSRSLPPPVDTRESGGSVISPLTYQSSV